MISQAYKSLLVASSLFWSAVIAIPLHAMEPKRKANRLIDTQSPYLLQHAYNPVDWFPWGNEAFAKAKEENKPVLISIGYSTCHWCHVMNRESFADQEIAAYLNENYICIKVDREERPDVDQVYMAFVQQLTGGGGWPLNVWLTPERKPFFGGTYFPPRPRPGYNSSSFKDILQRIQYLWTNDQEPLLEQSQKIVEALNKGANPSFGDSQAGLSWELVEAAIEAFSESFDEQNGGFGDEPKFPSPANISFLLRAAARQEVDSELSERANSIAIRTLDAMASSGTRDQIGGGFHRYAVDAGWQLPHYEKMLYDQGQLGDAYLDGWLATKNPAYRKVVETTLDYLLRDMQHENGGFYSAEDAESYRSKEDEKKSEGAFYVWSLQEIAEALHDEKLADFAIAYYSVTEAGNFPTGPYHTVDLLGYNTLRCDNNLDTLAEKFGITAQQAEQWVEKIDNTLFEARAKRPRPHLDDKIITSWNGMAISALARAGHIFDNPKYVEGAEQAAQFIKSNLYDAETGELIRLYRNSPSKVKGFADDYTFLIDGLLDLYEATANHEWLAWAKALQDKQLELFYDNENGGFFSMQESEEIIFERSKEVFDGALPADSSLGAKNLARLSQVYDDQAYAAKAQQTAAAFVASMQRAPTSMPALLDSVHLLLGKPVQIVIAGNPHSAEARAMQATANQYLLPGRMLLYADSGEGQAYLSKELNFLESMQPLGGAATAFVCENYVCQLPATTIDMLNAQLLGLSNHTMASLADPYKSED